jgi:phenylacetate-CoA ligase
MSMLLRLYHYLPAPARSAAATLRGLYLRAWRYGPETERLMEEVRDRERWSAERWRTWREERLDYVLHRAATRVPYYCEQWAARRRRGDRASWAYLENWPVLDKEPLRAHPTAFLADDCATRRMFHERTSGTTGKPLDLWRRRSTVAALYALSAVRTREWHGVSRHDRWAMLGGQLVTPVRQRRPPFWVWNAALNQLYMSTYHLAPDLIPWYLDALVRYRIVYLFGYTSSLHALAQEALHRDRRDIRMKVVITSAEPVTEDQRQTIAAAFQCPVRETYGMGELVAAASECESGRLHRWPEVGVVEVLDGARPVSAGALGDLVCTGLLNADMPLIRYRVGDCGRPGDDADVCTCGRTLPPLARVEGRSNDVLITRDGRRVSWLNPVFYGIPIRQGQIIQESLDHIRVRYVPAPGFTPEAGFEIVKRLQERMEGVGVVLERVDEVPRSASGKFRTVVCEVPAAQRDSVLRESRKAMSGS